MRDRSPLSVAEDLFLYAFELITRGAFGIASLFLIALACGMIVFAGAQVYFDYWTPDESVAPAILDAIGYTIISIAVFDVGKYLFEEEVLRGREMRKAGEARRSLTKFLSTIAIAIFLESLVAVFEASKSDEISNMIYPTFLLFGGVAMVVGLGIYQRLSAVVEKELREEVAAHEENAKPIGSEEQGPTHSDLAHQAPGAPS